jgi:hypothetical protein
MLIQRIGRQGTEAVAGYFQSLFNERIGQTVHLAGDAVRCVGRELFGKKGDTDNCFL